MRSRSDVQVPHKVVLPQRRRDEFYFGNDERFHCACLNLTVSHLDTLRCNSHARSLTSVADHRLQVKKIVAYRLLVND